MGTTTDLISTFTGFTAYRLIIGIPLDGVTKREIIDRSTTWKVLQQTPLLDYRRGAQPNAIKYFSTSYVQLGTTWCASWITPTGLPPSIRGAMIGTITTCLDTSVKNVWGVLVTRFIQGEGWDVLKRERFSLATKGLYSAMLHRGVSSTIYWSLYEPLHKRFPEHTLGVGFGVGMFQVCSTAPFYITAVRRQAKPKEGTPPLPKTLLGLMKEIARTEGVVRGLFLRGLFPRLIHSALTSGPLMYLLEKYKVIHR